MMGRAWPPAPTRTGGGLRVTWRELIVIIGTTIAIFGAVLPFGADRNDFALLFSGLLALLLVVILVTEEWARTVVARRANLLFVPACLLGLSCLAAAWSATPFGPNGSHPIWAYVDAVPAISMDRSTIFVGLAKLAGLACAFLLGWVVCSTDDRARYFLRTLVVAATIYGLWSLLANLNPALGLGLYGAFQNHRLSGSFQSANTAGTLFGMGFLLAICLVFEGTRHVSAGRGSLLAKITFPLIASALLGTCLVLTVSRGAATATLASCAGLVIWEMFSRDWHSIQKRNLFYGLASAGALLILAWSGDLLVQRYADSVKDWVDQRQLIYSVHWNAFLASPWFGYGLGTFDEVNKLSQDAINYPVLWNVRAAHNVYLQWLEQAGVAGSVPMFACIGWIITRTVLGVRLRHRMTTWLRGCVVVSLMVLIHGWSDFSLEVPAIAIFWSVVLGCGYAMSTSQAGAPLPALPSQKNRGISASPDTAKITAVATFSALVAALCIFAWWEIDAPFGVQPLLLPISNVYGYRAEQLLETELSSQTKTGNVQTAKALTDRELQLSPARADGWLRLAAIAALQEQPSTKIAQLLDRSYLVAPLDPQIFKKRTLFVLEHWDNITLSVRQEALAQVRTGWQNWIQRSEILALTKEVRNPAGRFAINLELARLNSSSGLIGKDN